MAGQSFAVTVTGDIAVAPEQVWAVLTDLDSAVATIPSIIAVERLTDGPYAVGTRWRESRRMMGREETHELTVVEAERPRRTVVTTTADGVDCATTMDLDPSARGTRLAITFEAVPPAATGRLRRLVLVLMAPVGRAMTRAMLSREFTEIRQAAEGKA